MNVGEEGKTEPGIFFIWIAGESEIRDNKSQCKYKDDLFHDFFFTLEVVTIPVSSYG